MSESTIPVAAIIRASSALQGREGKESIPRQKTSITETCSRYGLAIIKPYTLIDVSGGDIDQTPEWRELKGFLSNGVIEGVVVDNVDRLLRATEWNFNVYRDLADCGAKIWTPEGPKDPSDPSDTMFLGMVGLMGGNEKSKLARASWFAREEKRKRGEWAASLKSMPTGIAFDKASKTWSTTPDVEFVREVFRRFAGGESMNSICKSTGRGKSTISKWLHDPIYSGWMVRTHQQRGGPKIRRPDGRQPRRKAIPRAEPIRVQVFAEPPVPLHDWEAAQRRLEIGRARRPEKLEGSHARYPLRGVLFCACGQPVYGNGRKRGDGQAMPIYGCRVKLQGRLDWMQRQGFVCETGLASVDAVHEAVLGELAPKFRSPRYVSELALATMEADAARAKTGDGDHAASLRRKLSTLEKSKAKLLQLYLRDVIPVDELEVERLRIERDIDSTKAALDELEGPHKQEQDDALRAIIGGGVELGEVLSAIREGDVSALAEALRVSGSRVFVRIGKGRKAPIELTGIELRIADLSTIRVATPSVRAYQ